MKCPEFKTYDEFTKWYAALSDDLRGKFLAAIAATEIAGKNDVKDQLPALYAAQGFKVTELKGKCSFDETAFAYWYDGVQYAMDSHGKEDVTHSTNHLKLILERHHSVVKQVYDYCVALNVGDIWALTGGGCQLQVFFGNSTGYLAILYLDMDSSPMGQSYSADSDDDEDDGWTLQVQWHKNDPLFANMKITGVNVSTSEEVYGKDY
jgi:hypothetical protein